MSPSTWNALGAALAGVGVVAGAFGAHALEARLDAAGQLETWQTAVRYQVWHALALLLWSAQRGAAAGTGSVVGWCFLSGALLFSGSLYGLALGGPGALLGPLTPLGGVLLIAAWSTLCASYLRSGARRSSAN